MNKIIEMTPEEVTLEVIQNYRGQNDRGGYRENYRNDRGRSRSRER